MRTHLLLNRILTLAVFGILIGCEQTGTTETLATADPAIPPANPDQMFDDLDQIVFGFLSVENDENPANQLFTDRAGSLSILSFDPNSAIDREENSQSPNPKTIRTSSVGILQSLDTELGAVLQPEYTVYVENDSLFVLNLTTNEVRFVSQFPNTVCEILPYQTVSVSGDAGANQSFTVLDAETLYVRTTEASCFGNNTNAAERVSRYYRVALNYKESASDGELCVENGGSNTDVDNCFSDDFTPVLESEATAQLVMSWVEDDETADPNDHKPSWGYLGYGSTERALKYFDSERQEVWSQTRNILTTTPVDVGQSEFTPETIAEVKALDNDSGDLLNPFGFNYVLQLGRDLFVFDANNDLVDVPVSDRANLFSDRSYKMDQQFAAGSATETLASADFSFDSDEIVIVDNYRVHRFNYGASRFVPVVTREFEFSFGENVYNPANPRELEPFTQFDLTTCLADSTTPGETVDDDDVVDLVNLAACENAHDVEDTQLPAPGPAWAFIADCDAALGCTLPTNANDVCVTDAELLLDPSLADQNNPCTVEDYADLDELDMAANDAEFRGYMQYGEQMRGLDFFAHLDSLYITARMKERDLLVRYDYNEALTAIPTLREQVLLGRQFEYQGVLAQIVDGDLYVDVLRPSAIRNNECYKNYQRVSCELGNTSLPGEIDSCTAFDVDQGDCVTSFSEYKTYALFCSAAELAAETCIDDGVCAGGGTCNTVEAPIADRIVTGGQGQQTKWLPLRRQDQSNFNLDMLLLVSPDVADDPNDELDSGVRDEGVLTRPSVFDFEPATPAIAATATGLITKDVESVSDFVSSGNGNHVSLISEEVVQIGGNALDSTVSQVEQFSILDLGLSNGDLEPIANFQFLRPITEAR